MDPKTARNVKFPPGVLSVRLKTAPSPPKSIRHPATMYKRIRREPAIWRAIKAAISGVSGNSIVENSGAAAADRPPCVDAVPDGGFTGFDCRIPFPEVRRFQPNKVRKKETKKGTYPTCPPPSSANTNRIRKSIPRTTSTVPQ